MSDLLKIENLNKAFYENVNIIKKFRKKNNKLKVLNNINLNIKKGEILGLVGESGSGKTTFARTLMRLIEPDGGSAFYGGKNIFKMQENEVKMYLRKKFRMIFQHPDAALNPAFTVKMVFDQANNINQNRRYSPSDYVTMLDSVGLNKNFLGKMPYELSGGEKRRINICRALLTEPELIFADEPTSGLDLYLQHQILNILTNIRDLYKLSIVFISHDLGLVRKISDRICVMYSGQIVEVGSTDNITLDSALHPYTQDLLRADSGIKPSLDWRKNMSGLNVLENVSRYDEIEHCPYLENCIDYRINNMPAVCSKKTPILRKIHKDHFIACHLK